MRPDNIDVPQVVIIGGGITGLTAAYYLQKASRQVSFPLKITIVEQEARVGGKIGTELKDGFLIEHSADSFATFKPWGLELCRELGMEFQSINSMEYNIIEPSVRRYYMLINGGLHPIAMELLSFGTTNLRVLWGASFLSLKGKLRAGLEWLIPPKHSDDDESMASFLRRRFGKEFSQRLAEPLMASIHSGAPERLSIKATYPMYLEMETKLGSLTRAWLQKKTLFRETSDISSKSTFNSKTNAPFVSIRNGMGYLIERLVKKIKPEVRILTSNRVVNLVPQTDRKYSVILEDDHLLMADALILSVPAFSAAQILQEFVSQAVNQLWQIPYISTAVVSLAYRRSDICHPLDGSGFLVSSDNSTAITGCTWSSSKWEGCAPKGHVLLRVFMGSTGLDCQIETKKEDALVIQAQTTLEPLLGIRSKPVFYCTHRWLKGMPQYEVGHLARLEHVEKALVNYPGIILAGSAYRGVGIPDCVRQGKEAAEKVIKLTVGQKGT